MWLALMTGEDTSRKDRLPCRELQLAIMAEESKCAINAILVAPLAAAGGLCLLGPLVLQLVPAFHGSLTSSFPPSRGRKHWTYFRPACPPKSLVPEELFIHPAPALPGGVLDP
jgi:hypothetical protein